MSIESQNPAEPPKASVTDNGPETSGVRLQTRERQLSQLPPDELKHLAEELGVDSTRYDTPQELADAVAQRRQLIAAMDRDAMLDVIRWGRRPITINASKELIAQEISRTRTMRFKGLSQRGLIVLARLRGLDVSDEDTIEYLTKKLKRQEGIFSKFNRKRRAMLGSMVANLFGDKESSDDYQFLPPDPDAPAAPTPTPKSDTIKDEIEESGLFGGITNRIKRTADQYLNQKLDEVESRIDRKLDDIDRRLAEWRDREIANRIRILKITLWASVIVGIFSLIYSYITAYVWPH
jgi:hypothetical protein